MIPCPSTIDPALVRQSHPNTDWRNTAHALADRTQRAWLTRAGALTDGLREFGHLELEVLRETILLPSTDEARAMRLGLGYPVRVREVCMSINGIACVVARSVLTLDGFSGSWQSIRRLGKRPLADLLYRDRRVLRDHFEAARIDRFHPLGAAAKRYFLKPGPYMCRQRHHALWARRSVFWRQSQPLLVSECFLPAFWQILTTSANNQPRQVVNIKS